MPKNEKRNQLSGSLIIDKEQRLSQHIIASETSNLRNINGNQSNKIDIDEHKQIALYTEKLALLTEKQNFNPTETQSPMRFVSNQHRSRRGYTDHHRTEKKLIIISNSKQKIGKENGDRF